MVRRLPYSSISAARGLLACLALALPAPAIAADFDGDGVPDSVDNCIVNPNGSGPGEDGQADGDGDLLGDACDPIPGDADFDGAVSISDFRVWVEQQNVDCGGWPGAADPKLPCADFDNDGTVQISDLGVWVQHISMEARSGALNEGVTVIPPRHGSTLRIEANGNLVDGVDDLTCTAPCAAHLDARDTDCDDDGVTVSNGDDDFAEDLAECRFTWDYGDTTPFGNGSWDALTGTSRLPRNADAGFYGFHVYPNPGSYTARLSVRNAHGVAFEQEVDIEVQDPDAVLETYCFTDEAGTPEPDWSGCPLDLDGDGLCSDEPGAARCIADADSGTVGEFGGDGRRLLHKRGRDFRISTELATVMTFNGYDDLQLGAFPITPSGGDPYAFGDEPIVDGLRFEPKDGASRLSVFNLRVQSEVEVFGDQSTPLLDKYRDILFWRLKQQDVGRDKAFIDTATQGDDSRAIERVAIVEVEPSAANNDYHYWMGGARGYVFYANSDALAGPPDEQHGRMTVGDGGRISHNYFESAGAVHDEALLALRSCSWNTAGCDDYEMRDFIVSDNHFVQRSNRTTMAIGDGGTQAGALRNVIIERNYFVAEGVASHTEPLLLELDGWGIVRNNVFDLTESDDVLAAVVRINPGSLLCDQSDEPVQDMRNQFCVEDPATWDADGCDDSGSGIGDGAPVDILDCQAKPGTSDSNCPKSVWGSSGHPNRSNRFPCNTLWTAQDELDLCGAAGCGPGHHGGTAARRGRNRFWGLHNTVYDGGRQRTSSKKWTYFRSSSPVADFTSGAPILEGDIRVENNLAVFRRAPIEYLLIGCTPNASTTPPTLETCDDHWETVVDGGHNVHTTRNVFENVTLGIQSTGVADLDLQDREEEPVADGRGVGVAAARLDREGVERDLSRPDVGAFEQE